MKYLYLHGLGQNAGSWNKAIEATEVLIFVAGFAYFNKHAKKFAEIL